MPPTVRSIRTLRLDELLGSTLAALVDAEATAAKATAEFVEAVGFVARDESEDGVGDESSEGDLGKLRHVRFRFTKLGADNEPHDFELSLPMLAMVPIPMLQIDEAKLNMAVKILHVEVEAAPSGPTALPTSKKAALMGPMSHLTAMRHIRLVTQPAAKPSAGDTTRERDTVNLELEVTLKQADMPVGIEQLLHTFDQAISEHVADDGA